MTRRTIRGHYDECSAQFGDGPCDTGTCPAYLEKKVQPTVGDVWCARCDQEATDEFRQPDGSTVALCLAHVLDAQWKSGNFNWDRAYTR